ncbi:unnamed protein product [Hydatigera taeniaeformis]|uniref:Uncharacterized protein n=1 Tax=Hydatigena taeniaeformis TaxID=6205 RepID=A0A0R3X3Y4_HYDTA|nr:unnamed protein product [Hydatigera taeniaeformis]
MGSWRREKKPLLLLILLPLSQHGDSRAVATDAAAAAAAADTANDEGDDDSTDWTKWEKIGLKDQSHFHAPSATAASLHSLLVSLRRAFEDVRVHTPSHMHMGTSQGVNRNATPHTSHATTTASPPSPHADTLALNAASEASLLHPAHNSPTYQYPRTDCAQTALNGHPDLTGGKCTSESYSNACPIYALSSFLPLPTSHVYYCQKVCYPHRIYLSSHNIVSPHLRPTAPIYFLEPMPPPTPLLTPPHSSSRRLASASWLACCLSPTSCSASFISNTTTSRRPVYTSLLLHLHNINPSTFRSEVAIDAPSRVS